MRHPALALARVCLFSLLVLGLAWPRPSQAAVYVGITATGEEIGALPGAPINFDAVLISNFQVDITWVKGGAATNTVIRGKIGSYPVDITDGYEVYNGPGTSVTDWVDLSMVDEPMYYRAWSWNAIGYSLGYTEDYVEGGGVGMVNAIILIPLLGLLGGATIFGDWRRNWLVVIMATLGWFFMAAWSMNTSSATWDAYWILAVLSIGFALITAVWPLVNRPKELPKEDDDMTEEDRAWGGKRHQPRGRQRWDGD